MGLEEGGGVGCSPQRIRPFLWVPYCSLMSCLCGLLPACLPACYSADLPGGQGRVATTSPA